MRQIIKRFFSVFLPVVLLGAGLQSSRGFALLGPLGNGGDSWQTAALGYGLAYADLSSQSSPGGPVFLGDIGGPKNIGEEYRRNTPFLYYSYDANFLDYFGANGATATDGAYTIMNNLTNVSSYSSDLSEFPLNSQHFNFTAQSLFLTDLKSVTLHLLVEQMGLAAPERFTWTLAERLVGPAPGCPLNVFYLVVQRNFGIIPSTLDQLQYSAYVNDILYTYFISEACRGTPTAITIPFAVDPEAEEYTAVAANDGDGFGGLNFSSGGGLQVGGYYTGLTRDDVGGLRYLYRAGNINTENVAATSLTLTTNFPPPQLITTLSYGLFISQLTNDPVTLQGLYPTLNITSTTTNFALTNVIVVAPTYTNFPGATVTNFVTPTFSVLLTNFDLSLFSALAQTSSPAALQALYPQLLIINFSILYYTNFPTPNTTTYLTNPYAAPFGSPPIQVTVTNSFAFNIFPVYAYTFGNILTNYFSSNNIVSVQTISVTNLIGAPVGSPQSTNSPPPVNKTITNTVSGDFFLIPTNWCGFTVFQKFEQRLPSYTNSVVAAGTTNTFGIAQFTQNTISFYTNRIWVFEPGICEPALVFATNVTSVVLTNYQYTFGNLFTNLPTQQFTNTVIITTITNIFASPTNPAGVLTTNRVTTTNVISFPSGDFFIIDPTWTCGFSILQVVATNQVGATNTTTALIPAGVTNVGQQYSVTTVSYYTNHVLEIQPFICQTTPAGPALREGIERIQFIRANFDSLIGQFFQPITNIYTMTKITNSQTVTETFRRVITRPDILMTASDDIAANTFVGSVTRNIVFDQSTVLPGLAGPGVINGPVAFSYNKIGSVFNNGSIIDLSINNTNLFLSELTQYKALAWGAFDGSTNPPVVFPNGTSIQNLENEILVQIYANGVLLASLPNGNNGVAYPTMTITATGGSFSPPFTWSASGLPTGVTLSSDGTLSGTPTQSGTFNVTIQLTDSLLRTVNWNYSLTIQ